MQGISYKINPNNPQQLMPYSYKKYENKIYKFDFMVEESSGTLVLLKYYTLFHWLEKQGGGVLVVDELDAHLHPLMVIEFLRYVNQKNSKHVVQVIATIHNTALLDSDILEADQIYLVEKQDHISKIASIADYNLSDEQKKNLERTYLSGQLGAVPDLHAIDIAIADDKNNL
jgi:AAA15 family ATPase/GTPase